MKSFGKFILAALLVAGIAIAFVPRKPATPPQKKARPINPAIPPVSAELKPRAPEPQTLQELLALSPDQLEQVDLATINLLCATGLRGAENLDIQQHLATLDQWAGHVARETLRNFHNFTKNPQEYGGTLGGYRMMMLATVLQEDFQAHYSPERAEPQLRGEREPNNKFFADSQDVFLHGLLGGKRTGTCASLPVLYVAVAQRLGYPVKLFSTREHFYVRYDDGDEQFNIDATCVGFKTFPDDYYRTWPAPITKEDERAFGWLRARSKQELLGDFLTTRAFTLTSMKRFADVAETWEQAAKRLPQTPALKWAVQHTRERAANERAADRWDELYAEVANLPVPSKPGFAEVKDKQLRLQRWMSQSTNLVMTEKAVVDLKRELDEVFKREALAADSPRVQMSNTTIGPAPSSFDPKAMELLATATEAVPVRIRIPAERVPVEYWQGLPPALQERLRGSRNTEDIITEIYKFQAEEMNRRHLAAMAAMQNRPMPPPPGVQPEWLPPEYRQTMPMDLRNRLAITGGKAQAEWTVHQYQTEQMARQQGAELRRQSGVEIPLTGPQVQVEIMPASKGKP